MKATIVLVARNEQGGRERQKQESGQSCFVDESKVAVLLTLQQR